MIEKLTDEELNTLKIATTEEEWNSAADAIKSNHNGEYPSDWYEKVILSGVMGSKDFGGIKIVTF